MKEESPIKVTEEGLFIFSSRLQLKKEFEPIVFTDEGLFIFSSDLQLKKEFEHSMNVLISIIFNEEGNSILASDEHPLKDSLQI